VTVWKLLWELVKHVLHGRGKDEVQLTLDVGFGSVASGAAASFDWAGDHDAFCVVQGTGVVEHVYEALEGGIPR
jgi:hypothetical protein